MTKVKFTHRNIDDVRFINNPKFGESHPFIYPPDLDIEDD